MMFRYTTRILVALLAGFLATNTLAWFNNGPAPLQLPQPSPPATAPSKSGLLSPFDEEQSIEDQLYARIGRNPPAYDVDIRTEGSMPRFLVLPTGEGVFIPGIQAFGNCMGCQKSRNTQSSSDTQQSTSEETTQQDESGSRRQKAPAVAIPPEDKIEEQEEALNDGIPDFKYEEGKSEEDMPVIPTDPPYISEELALEMANTALKKHWNGESTPHHIGGQSSTFIVTITIEGIQYQVLIKDVLKGLKADTPAQKSIAQFRLDQANNEAFWLEQLPIHSNIALLLGSHTTIHGDIGWIMTPRYVGDLYDLLLILHGHALKLNQKDIDRMIPASDLYKNLHKHLFYLIQGLISGLKAMENAGVVHHDLSPDNILIEILPDGHFNLRISDFGGAGTRGTWDRNFIGKRAFLPLEVLQQLNSDRGIYLHHDIDLWQFGTLMAMLVSKSFYDHFTDQAGVTLDSLKLNIKNFDFISFNQGLLFEIEQEMSEALVSYINSTGFDQLVDELLINEGAVYQATFTEQVLAIAWYLCGDASSRPEIRKVDTYFILINPQRGRR